MSTAEPAAHERGLQVGPASADLSRALEVELAGSLNLRRTTLRVLDLARSRIADWALLVLDDPRHRQLHLAGGDDPRFAVTLHAEEPLGPVDELLVRHRFLEGDTGGSRRLVERLLPDPARRAQADDLATDLLAMPLTARGGTVGVLLLGRHSPRGFDEADLTLARQLADRAALALDSARIYEEHARITRVLEDSLRPTGLVSSPGLDLAATFRSAASHLEVGGDFYDVHGEGDDQLVVLGDVCGKGVEAAMLNGRSRQSIRTAARFDRSPGTILSVLNDVLYEDASDRFVTVVCARVRRVDAGTVDVDVAVAGHPAPLVLRADGSIEEPQVRGRLAGVIQHGEQYDETTVRLHVGDAMILFSDGIYEARGSRGLYGMDRFRRLLEPYAGTGAHALCEAIEQDVVEHLGGHGHDDMTAVAIAPRHLGSTS
jgi:serine phosphatase RsbU (regulator of sigma subunit)